MAPNKKYSNLSLQSVLAPEMRSIWDSISLGVTIIDASGNCVYMNPVQCNIDGFDVKTVLGEHITNFYTPETLTTSPILHCLATGKADLKRIYWYKTTTNKLINSVNDFIPLFDNGKIDGVISFSSIFGLPSITEAQQKSAPERPREEPAPLYSFGSIVGSSPQLKKGIDTARAAAKSSSHVMIWGESGTGKELFAQAIHAEGVRRDKPFIPINCSAIPEHLLEGFMFGTVKGAFTDAADRAGLFENANGGTLLLDEINSMPLGLQAKLLRAIQEKRIRRVGSQKEIPVDVRIISILNEHPLTALEQGKIRSDLYYRLAVVGISVPPLRERKEDILYLADYFIRASKNDLPGTVRLSDKVCGMFINYSWPGNIRELQNVVEGSLTMLDGDGMIQPEHLPQQLLESYNAALAPVAEAPRNVPVANGTPSTPQPLQHYYDYKDIENRAAPTPLKSCMLEYERNCIKNVLRYTGGNVAKAARLLEMKPAALHYRINLLGLSQ